MVMLPVAVKAPLRASETRTIRGREGALRLSASLTSSVIGNFPAPVGVPASVPPGLRPIPPGSGPVSVQTSAPWPELAVN